MRVFGYHYGPNGISHYRVWQPLKYLKDWGVKAFRLPNEIDNIKQPMTGHSNIPGIPSHEKVSLDYDVIFSTYVTSLDAVSRFFAQAHNCPVVIDVDDDIYAIDESHTDHKKWKSGGAGDIVHEIPEGAEEEYRIKAGKMKAEIIEKDGKLWYVQTGSDPVDNIETLLKLAHGLTVSTPRLVGRYKHLNSNICVVPNCVDPDIYPERVPAKDGKIRLGLFGANAHYYDWKVLADQVKRVLRENKNVVLCVNTWKVTTKETAEMGLNEDGSLDYTADFWEDIPRDQLEIHHFTTIGDWHKFLADSGVEIGLAPLTDSMFNRAKSNLKYIEWSALGIPGVYSDVEAYNTSVIPGKTGFLAKPGDWYKYVTRLVRDEAERRLMGSAAKADVLNHHHQREASRVLAGFLKQVRERYEKTTDRRVTV